MALRYFSDLFQSIGVHEALRGVSSCVTEDTNSVLRVDYTAEGVKTTLSQMSLIKARGPNGMRLLFYHTYWHIVSSFVFHLVLSIL